MDRLLHTTRLRLRPLTPDLPNTEGISSQELSICNCLQEEVQGPR